MTEPGPAPFRADLAEGPAGGQAVWVRADDGVRLRVGFWPSAGASGTVLLFPGRTEYIEKYGRIAGDLTSAGYHVAAIDWRGQGFADRLAEDARLGHVNKFTNYQRDVAAMVDATLAAELPRPWFLLSHSMGGCIGLRALIEGLSVRRAVFSSPMFGIHVAPALEPLARVLPPLAQRLGQGLRYAPGTRPTNYLTDADFETNMLTTDRDHFDYLGRQIAGEPHFTLGGPSLHWFGEARNEGRVLEAMPRPGLPVLSMMGSEEMIVDTDAAMRFHANWPSARIEVIAGARHELMMESPGRRGRFLKETLRFFAADS